MKINSRLCWWSLVFAIPLILSFPVLPITIDTEKLFLSKQKSQIRVPRHYQTYWVNNAKETYQALAKIHREGGFAAIFFREGVYQLKNTLNIRAPNIMLLSVSASPQKTVLRGNGMKASKGVDNLIRVAAPNFVLDGLTLEQSGNHLIQIAGESGATKPVIRNCILQDGYEQLFKVTYNRKYQDKFSDQGIVESCLFQYSKGTGPNYYIGGIDAHGIQNWTIRNNIFVNIASPSQHIAEHSIHLWNDTNNNLVEKNIIINSDRGIGFGMRQKKVGYARYSNRGGVIKNNIIYHARNTHKFADTGIILEDSPETVVDGNIIYFEHDYPNAIEFRFANTSEVIIKNNYVNRRIKSRNSGQASILNNEISELSRKKLELNLKDFIAQSNF